MKHFKLPITVAALYALMLLLPGVLNAQEDSVAEELKKIRWDLSSMSNVGYAVKELTTALWWLFGFLVCFGVFFSILGVVTTIGLYRIGGKLKALSSAVSGVAKPPYSQSVAHSPMTPPTQPVADGHPPPVQH